MPWAKRIYNLKVTTILHVLLKKLYFIHIKQEIQSLCLYIIIIPC